MNAKRILIPALVLVAIVAAGAFTTNMKLRGSLSDGMEMESQDFGATDNQNEIAEQLGAMDMQNNATATNTSAASCVKITQTIPANFPTEYFFFQATGERQSTSAAADTNAMAAAIRGAEAQCAMNKPSCPSTCTPGATTAAYTHTAKTLIVSRSTTTDKDAKGKVIRTWHTTVAKSVGKCVTSIVCTTPAQKKK